MTVVEVMKAILGDPGTMLVGIISIRLTNTGRSILNVGRTVPWSCSPSPELNKK